MTTENPRTPKSEPPKRAPVFLVDCVCVWWGKYRREGSKGLFLLSENARRKRAREIWTQAHTHTLCMSIFIDSTSEEGNTHTYRGRRRKKSGDE